MYIQLIKLLKKREDIFLNLKRSIKRSNNQSALNECRDILRLAQGNIFSLTNKWKADDIEYLYEISQLSKQLPIEKTAFVLNLFDELHHEYFVDVYNEAIQNFVQEGM